MKLKSLWPVGASRLVLCLLLRCGIDLGNRPIKWRINIDEFREIAHQPVESSASDEMRSLKIDCLELLEIGNSIKAGKIIMTKE